MAKFFATFAFISVLAVAMLPASSYAQVANPEPPTPVYPTSCTLAPPEVFVSGIQFETPTPTNFPGLQWNWTFTPPETPEGEGPFAFDNYSYAIYNGTELKIEGALAAAATTIGYAAPADGVYSLYLWTDDGEEAVIIEGEEAAAIEPTYCNVASIPLDTTAPVFTNNGFTLNNTTGIATPLLTTEETGVTYSWTVDGLTSDVEIDNPTALNPVFTFLRDSTYIFTLTATDIFGNATIIPFTIIHLQTYLPPVAGPEIIPVESLPEPVQAFTPIQEPAPIARSTAIPPIDGKLPPVVDASIYSSTAQARDEESKSSEKDFASGVTAGNNGWKIMGVSWYWWILLAAIVATAWLWALRTYRSRSRPDDV